MHCEYSGRSNLNLSPKFLIFGSQMLAFEIQNHVNYRQILSLTSADDISLIIKSKIRNWVLIIKQSFLYCHYKCTINFNLGSPILAAQLTHPLNSLSKNRTKKELKDSFLCNYTSAEGTCHRQFGKCVGIPIFLIQASVSSYIQTEHLKCLLSNEIHQYFFLCSVTKPLQKC